MHIIHKRPGDQIKLGRKREYNARRIALDLTAWQSRYGADGAVQLLYQRPGDATPYPVTLTRENHLALWTVAAADTANSGSSGRAELRYYVGDALVKSAISQVVVEPSLGEPTNTPNETQQSWLDQAVQAGSAAQNSAATAAAHATTAQSSAQNSATSAQSAQSSAQSSAASAQSAQSSAQSSAASAVTAQTAAAEAKAVLDAAREDASTVKPSALIDDTAVASDALWSSQNVVDHLCGTFEERGTKITCHPVADTPLHVISQINAEYAWEEEPAPDCSVPIVGWGALELEHSSETDTATHSLKLGQTIYGGTMDWHSGVLTVDRRMYTFSGTEDWQVSGNRLALADSNVSWIKPNPDSTVRRGELCSHYPVVSGDDTAGQITGICTTNDGIAVYDPTYEGDVEAWKDFLAELKTGGDPLHAVFLLKQPYTVQFDPTQITALPGNNYLQCAAGDLTVSGTMDFRHEIQALKDAVAALKN